MLDQHIYVKSTTPWIFTQPEKGRKEGIELGREEGVLRGKRQLVQSMLSEGLDRATVCRIAQLT